MTEKIVAVAAADGDMETFVAHPDGDGPFPIVVIYMDAPGIREELHGFARRIAEQGYFCALPDLYYRRGRVRYDLSAMTAAEAEEMFDHMRSLTLDGVLADTRELLIALGPDPAASDGPMGCIGYCMSGQYVMNVAGTLPDHFHAAVSCYGVGIVTSRPDSPHILAPDLRGEILFAFAEHDEYVPDDVIPTLRTALDGSDVRHEVLSYPGTEHGFCFPERDGAYDEDAAEDVWARTFEIFARQLS